MYRPALNFIQNDFVCDDRELSKIFAVRRRAPGSFGCAHYDGRAVPRYLTLSIFISYFTFSTESAVSLKAR